LGDKDVKGMLIGLQKECGFIPVLRLYAAHQLRLLDGIGTKIFEDKERWHKSLPTLHHRSNADTYSFFENRYQLSAEECELALSRVLTDNLTDCVDFNLLKDFTKVDL
jgi:hypothetical protein